MAATPSTSETVGSLSVGTGTLLTSDNIPKEPIDDVMAGTEQGTKRKAPETDADIDHSPTKKHIGNTDANKSLVVPLKPPIPP